MEFSAYLQAGYFPREVWINRDSLRVKYSN